MTMPEVAEMLRTPVATLKYWRSIGYGPAGFKVGRRVLYRRDAVRAWLDQLAPPAA
jgi:DNA-binding transcriptional MerR regulator